MAELSIEYTLGTPAGNLVFNRSASSAGFSLPAGDEFRIVDIHGLDEPTLRPNRRPAPQGDGEIIGDVLYGAREITVDIELKPRPLTEAAMRAARNAMEDALVEALAAIRLADGTWSFTRTGGSLRSYDVRRDAPLYPTQTRGVVKGFTFGLVSPE
jgi:hypothetical protein